MVKRKKTKVKGFKIKTISIKPKQNEFIEKNNISLSKITQEQIEKLMAKRRDGK